MLFSIKHAALTALTLLSFVNTVATTNTNTTERKTLNPRNTPYKNIPSDLPISQLTHVIYAFANITASTGEVFLAKPFVDTKQAYADDLPSPDNTNLRGALGQLYRLKSSHRHLKTLLSIGGPHFSRFFPAATSTAEKRSRFVASAVRLLADLGVDGIDLDWEYPTTKEEGGKYLLLLQELRRGLDAYSAKAAGGYHFLLTVASPAEAKPMSYMPLGEMAAVIDWFNLMAYDYSGPWSKVSGHQSNLFSPGMTGDGTKAGRSTEGVVDGYLRKGVPSGKIVLGIPLYGRSFKGTDGPGSSFEGTGEYEYKELPLKGADVVSDAAAGATYTYDKTTREMVTFDTPEMIRMKVRWLKERVLAGCMFWESSMDKSDDRSLIATSHTLLGSVDMAQNQQSYQESAYDNVRGDIS
ncbi:glycoside hydrolase family 18 protein [Cercophora newfieldiana]|uniref:chitinase n=1 Tax=Cercophora newfieldiana TaxID=92897 RepID=A0AA40CM09_9PEZI|nr:glycoside hydrolase family 18 protein [Cercophora newfieldiana]